VGAPAGSYNIICDAGATLTRTLTWKDSAGTLVNLSGYTGRMQVRADVESASTVLSLTTANGGLTLGGAAGTVLITVSSTESATLTAGDYVYDLELVTAGGVVTRLVQGTFTVRAEVTR
jgi:hypothetical protein